MNRGDQRENIFRDDADRQLFLATLGEACGKTEWQVHAYVVFDGIGVWGVRGFAKSCCWRQRSKLAPITTIRP